MLQDTVQHLVNIKSGSAGPIGGDASGMEASTTNLENGGSVCVQMQGLAKEGGVQQSYVGETDLKQSSVMNSAPRNPNSQPTLSTDLSLETCSLQRRHRRPRLLRQSSVPCGTESASSAVPRDTGNSNRQQAQLRKAQKIVRHERLRRQSSAGNHNERRGDRGRVRQSTSTGRRKEHQLASNGSRRRPETAYTQPGTQSRSRTVTPRERKRERGVSQGEDEPDDRRRKRRRTTIDGGGTDRYRESSRGERVRETQSSSRSSEEKSNVSCDEDWESKDATARVVEGRSDRNGGRTELMSVEKEREMFVEAISDVSEDEREDQAKSSAQNSEEKSNLSCDEDLESKGATTSGVKRHSDGNGSRPELINIEKERGIHVLVEVVTDVSEDELEGQAENLGVDTLDTGSTGSMETLYPALDAGSTGSMETLCPSLGSENLSEPSSPLSTEDAASVAGQLEGSAAPLLVTELQRRELPEAIDEENSAFPLIDSLDALIPDFPALSPLPPSPVANRSRLSLSPPPPHDTTCPTAEGIQEEHAPPSPPLPLSPSPPHDATCPTHLSPLPPSPSPSHDTTWLIVEGTQEEHAKHSSPLPPSPSPPPLQSPCSLSAPNIDPTPSPSSIEETPPPLSSHPSTESDNVMLRPSSPVREPGIFPLSEGDSAPNFTSQATGGNERALDAEKDEECEEGEIVSNDEDDTVESNASGQCGDERKMLDSKAPVEITNSQPTRHNHAVRTRSRGSQNSDPRGHQNCDPLGSRHRYNNRSRSEIVDKHRSCKRTDNRRHSSSGSTDNRRHYSSGRTRQRLEKMPEALSRGRGGRGERDMAIRREESRRSHRNGSSSIHGPYRMRY